MVEQDTAEHTPRWRRLWRSFILPLNAVALIVLLIWLLDNGRLPGLSSNGSTTSVSDSDFYSTSGEPLGADRGSGPGLGKPAPEFTLLDTGGKVVHLSDFRGKVVVLDFWATWCPPCRKEFPELVKTYAGGTGDVVVVGINMQENRDQVRAFADDYGADFPILIDPKAEAADAYRLLGLPSTYFIDQQGVLREQHFGLLKREIIDDKIGKTRAAGIAAVP
ncbi:MAG: redoxin domain-containing protein [Dehalococcoidia bacterium]